MDKQELLIISTFILPLVIAITLHEAGHAFAAYRLGDPTAKLAGRLSLNPLRHVDPRGTILLPGILLLLGGPAIGYAKPVPVNFTSLRHPRRDAALVALAGPGMNILLAILCALALHAEAFLSPDEHPWLFANLYNGVTINVLLAVFNMLPILPLDGGRVLNAALPPGLARRHAASERFGMLIVALIVLAPALLNQWHIIDIPVGYYLIGMPAQWLHDLILHGAGIGNG